MQDTLEFMVYWLIVMAVSGAISGLMQRIKTK